MNIGDLVRLRPEHNDVGWLDVIFIVIEKHEDLGMVKISNQQWAFPMPIHFLEVINE
jgi:hypothetical protein